MNVYLPDSMLNFLRFIGVNRAVGYGLLSRVWGLLSGPVTMFIIATKFSKEQQGFLYTISSLLALQVFFELGLTNVIATFASHEFAKLKWEEKGKISGDTVALERFKSLLCKTTMWYTVAALLMIIMLIPAGFLFFGNKNGADIDFVWRLPWIMAVIGTALNLITVPFFSVIMGSGDVATVNHRTMLGAVIGSCISWLVMLTNGGLFAIFAVTLGNIIISWSYLFKYKPELLKMVLNSILHKMDAGHTESTVSWWGEIWPMQWKIAISWISGYFIYQLFNPVLFYYHGAVIAGQMGMTLIAWGILISTGTIWIQARSPEFGKLIAKREWKELDRLFYRVFCQLIGIVTAGAIAGWTLIWLLQLHYQKVGERFLPAPQVALLLTTAVFQIVVTAFATYLRAHKQEPFLIPSVIGAVLQGTATLLIGKYYSSIGIIISFVALTMFFGLPSGYFIWKHYRKIWHSG